MWFLYVAVCNDHTLYTGITTDVSRREAEHNKGARGAKYTRTRRPVKIIFQASFSSRGSAQRAEYDFKQKTRHEKIAFLREKDIVVDDSAWHTARKQKIKERKAKAKLEKEAWRASWKKS